MTMGPKKGPLGRKIAIHLNKDNIFESFIQIDGHPIHGVNKVEVIASSDHTQPPRVILHLHPDIVEIDGIANIEAFLDIEQKYDRFDNLLDPEE